MRRKQQRRLRKSSRGTGGRSGECAVRTREGWLCWAWFRSNQRRTGTDLRVSTGEVTMKSNVRGRRGDADLE